MSNTPEDMYDEHCRLHAELTKHFVTIDKDGLPVPNEEGAKMPWLRDDCAALRRHWEAHQKAKEAAQ